MQRARFVTHQGQPILFIDLSNLDGDDEILGVIADARAIIDQQPEDSLAILTFVQGARVSDRVSEAMKAFAAKNNPYVVTSAVVGLSTMQRMLFEAVRMLTGRDIRAFDSLPPAKDWLVRTYRERRPADEAGTAEPTEPTEAVGTE